MWSGEYKGQERKGLGLKVGKDMEKEVATQACWGRLCVGAWVRVAIVANRMEIPSEKFGESGLPIFPRTTSESVNSICGQSQAPEGALPAASRT